MTKGECATCRYSIENNGLGVYCDTLTGGGCDIDNCHWEPLQLKSGYILYKEEQDAK